jgi:hypothetical protein
LERTCALLDERESSNWILRPHVSEKTAWIVDHHTVCHQIGIDLDMHDAHLGHPYYEHTAEFADLYD